LLRIAVFAFIEQRRVSIRRCAMSDLRDRRSARVVGQLDGPDWSAARYQASMMTQLLVPSGGCSSGVDGPTTR
jgi:hypothetical protein